MFDIILVGTIQKNWKENDKGKDNYMKGRREIGKKRGEGMEVRMAKKKKRERGGKRKRRHKEVEKGKKQRRRKREWK